MALLALPHLAHLDAVAVAKGLGVLAALALLGLTAWWAGRLVDREERVPDGGPAPKASVGLG